MINIEHYRRRFMKGRLPNRRDLYRLTCHALMDRWWQTTLRIQSENRDAFNRARSTSDNGCD